MNTSLPGADATAWSSLWARTRQGSIDLTAVNPVSDTLRGHWEAQLPWLVGCRHAADIGSGPAILPMLLRQLALGRLDGLTWECIDEASLPVEPIAPTIHLRGETDFASSTPLRGAVQALVSNFGLEYVARQDVAAASARWLAPGGRLCAVVHRRDSLIDRTSIQSLDDLSVVLDELSLFGRADRLLHAMATLPDDAAARATHASDVRAAYNAAVDDLKQRMTDRGSRSAVWIDILTALTQLARLAGSGQSALARERAQAMAADYAAERTRLQAMRASACTADDLAALVVGLQAAGLQTSPTQDLTCSLGMIGSVLTAQRPR